MGVEVGGHINVEHLRHQESQKLVEIVVRCVEELSKRTGETHEFTMRAISAELEEDRG